MKSRNGKVSVAGVVVLLLAISAVTGVFMLHSKNMQRKKMEEHQAREAKRIERERAERAIRERQLREEEEFERKRREARLAQEKEEEEREAERISRKKAAEAAEAERQRKLAEAKANRERYRLAQASFHGEIGFVENAPDDDKPMSTSIAKLFWCVFPSYSSDNIVYEIKVASKGQMEVFALSADAMPQSENAEQFASRMKSEPNATTSGGNVWLNGATSPVGVFPTPQRGKDFCLLETVLDNLYEPLVALGASMPKTGYSVRLKSDSGKTNIDLGTIQLSDSIAREKLEELIGREIGKNASKGISSKSEVKKQKFKRTVELYDGTYIKKEISGITKVPRKYVFHGTNQHTGSGWRQEREFRRKWQALYDEAVRQDEQEMKIEAEYAAELAREKAELEQKRAHVESLSSDERAVDAALAKCKIYVTIEKKKNTKKTRK